MAENVAPPRRRDEGGIAPKVFYREKIDPAGFEISPGRRADNPDCVPVHDGCYGKNGGHRVADEGGVEITEAS